MRSAADVRHRGGAGTDNDCGGEGEQRPGAEEAAASAENKRRQALLGVYISVDDDASAADYDYDNGGDLQDLENLLRNYGRPEIQELIGLSRRYALGNGLRECCLGAVDSADNPFIPGMNLSLALSGAAAKAPEGERGGIWDIQRSVDALLLEIFERLPQTVRAFEGGMDGCAEVLEPRLESTAGGEDGSAAGAGRLFDTPLQMMLAKRQQRETFCTVPLVVDFLSRRFTQGLPDLTDSDEILQNGDELEYLNHARTDGRRNGLVLGDGGMALSRLPWFRHGTFRDKLEGFRDPRTILQAAHAEIPSLTLLPGAQFIAAGMVSKPNNYYRVPSMRMALDWVVYLLTITWLTVRVFLHEDGPVSAEEGLFGAMFVVSGVYRESRELWHDVGGYFKDRWNVFDGLGLLFLGTGLVVRAVDAGSPWGRAFYALSAPLLVSRILFFAQIHPFEGPVIQVIFAMTSVLLKFGFLMAIVMLGFAISFYVLFQTTNLSFSDVFLELFKAMLGEANFFEFFEDELRFPFVAAHYREVATLLLVVYLFFITIMLLNLLIAILNTSHAEVQEDVHRAFKVSKARMIENYRFVVDKDLLPAPFNMLPLVVAPLLMLLPSRFADVAVDRATSKNAAARRSCWRKAHDRAKNLVGRVAFWLVMGPLAVAGGQALWALSAPHALYKWHQCYNSYREQDSSPTSCSSAAPPGGGEEGQAEEERRKSRLGPASIALRYALILAWCFLGAPLALAVLWVRASVQVVLPSMGKSFHDEPSPGRRGDLTIEAMLKKAPHGVGADKLREFLEDPMGDEDVRRDEVTKSTTVEHLKGLRNRLERTTRKELKALDQRLGKLESESKANKEMLEEILGIVKKMA